MHPILIRLAHSRDGICLCHLSASYAAVAPGSTVDPLWTSKAMTQCGLTLPQGHQSLSGGSGCSCEKSVFFKCEVRVRGRDNDNSKT